MAAPSPKSGQLLSQQPAAGAGASCQAEYDRHHQKRARTLERRWGRLAGVAKALSDDPQSTKAWARGADFERRLARDLDRLLGDRAVFLHDRRVGRANIDHLVVAATGVWIVDAKNYKGLVEHRNVAGWLRRPDWRILVDSHDRTKLARGLEWQVEAVDDALAGIDAPIHPVLCFPVAAWGIFARPFRHQDVLVTWAKKLAELIVAPGGLTPAQVELVVGRLDQALPPAK